MVAALLLGITCLLPPAAGAATSKAAEPAKTAALPPFLQKLERAGKLQVLRTFSTSKPGMTGYVIQQGKAVEVVFGEAGYVFAGQLMSPAGDDLTALYSEEYVPKPDVTATVKSLEHLGHLIVQGDAHAPMLYVFADPNCFFCYRFFQAVEPLVKQHKLQVRWVMVGFLKRSSIGRAAAILEAADPLKALEQDETAFNVAAEEGGTPPLQHPSANTQQVLQAHASAMHDIGSEGTPTVLYRKDGKWAALVGMPPDGWLENYIARASDKGGAGKK